MDWMLWATLLAALAVCMFIGAYLTLAPWWRSQEGQNVLLLSLLILALCVIGFLRRAGMIGSADTVVGLAWLGVAITYTWRTGLLIRAQGFLSQRRSPTEPPHPGPADGTE